jgi:hypothetical protein
VDVLAFTMLESAEDVARVERAASHRMSAARGWHGWHIIAVEMEPDEDDLWRVKVFCDPVGGGYREMTALQFLVSQTATRVSRRFQALLASCGLTKIDDTDDLVGRYFATRNQGRGSSDFGSLTNALVG